MFILRMNGDHFVLLPNLPLVCLGSLSLRWPKYLKGNQNYSVINFYNFALDNFKRRRLPFEDEKTPERGLMEIQKAKEKSVTCPSQICVLETISQPFQTSKTSFMHTYFPEVTPILKVLWLLGHRRLYPPGMMELKFLQDRSWVIFPLIPPNL